VKITHLNWKIDHVNPTKIIILQTNIIIGYYGNNHYNILLGIDQLKYVMNKNKIAHIDHVIGACLSDSSELICQQEILKLI